MLCTKLESRGAYEAKWHISNSIWRGGNLGSGMLVGYARHHLEDF